MVSLPGSMAKLILILGGKVEPTFFLPGDGAIDTVTEIGL
jgi:hypothetical protein